MEEVRSGERRAPLPRNAVTEFNEFDDTEEQRRLIQARNRALNLQESRRLNERELSLLGSVSNRWRDGEPAEGVRTAGLIISPDGKTLWAGCERGIFEYTINLMERRTFPAFEMR
jgi:hypothetical protein